METLWRQYHEEPPIGCTSQSFPQQTMEANREEENKKARAHSCSSSTGEKDHNNNEETGMQEHVARVHQHAAGVPKVEGTKGEGHNKAWGHSLKRRLTPEAGPEEEDKS